METKAVLLLAERGGQMFKTLPSLNVQIGGLTSARRRKKEKGALLKGRGRPLGVGAVGFCLWRDTL